MGGLLIEGATEAGIAGCEYAGNVGLTELTDNGVVAETVGLKSGPTGAELVFATAYKRKNMQVLVLNNDTP